MKRTLLIFLTIFTAFVFGFIEFTNPSPPSAIGDPPRLYSNDVGDHLEDTIVASIKNAKHSIVLLIYSLKDAKIIQALNNQANKGIEVKIIYDAVASKGIEKRLSAAIKQYPRLSEGLMHQKILIIDGEETWLGSANMTRDSLQRHSNLIAHLYSPAFAEAALQKAEQLSVLHYEAKNQPATFMIGGQRIELRFLPDDETAIPHIRSLISTAKKSLKVAMYTFTRQDLAYDLIKASQRGVKVSVALDNSSSKGSSSKICELLENSGIAVKRSNGDSLLHHKFLIIDDETLVHGSANWTKAAFNQNDDCIMIIHELTPAQLIFLNRLWGMLARENP